MHPDAVAPGQDQTRLSQHPQVPGDLGLGGGEGPVQLADAALVRAEQQGQDAAADGVGEGIEKGLLVERCRRRRAALGPQASHASTCLRLGTPPEWTTWPSITTPGVARMPQRMMSAIWSTFSSWISIPLALATSSIRAWVLWQLRQPVPRTFTSFMGRCSRVSAAGLAAGGRGAAGPGRSDGDGGQALLGTRDRRRRGQGGVELGIQELGRLVADVARDLHHQVDLLPAHPVSLETFHLAQALFGVVGGDVGRQGDQGDDGGVKLVHG